jgi:hypothetical protein
MSKTWIGGLYNKCMLSFVRNKLFSKVAVPFYISPTVYERWFASTPTFGVIIIFIFAV